MRCAAGAWLSLPWRLELQRPPRQPPCEEVFHRSRGAQGQHDAADADAHDGGDLQQPQPDGASLSTLQLGAPQAEVAQEVEEHVGHGGKPQSQWVGAKRMGAGPVGEEAQLLLLDAVLHVASGAVEFLVEGLRRVGLLVEGRDDEARVVRGRGSGSRLVAGMGRRVRPGGVRVGGQAEGGDAEREDIIRRAWRGGQAKRWRGSRPERNASGEPQWCYATPACAAISSLMPLTHPGFWMFTRLESRAILDLT
jgi:hypothetical protein